MKYATAQEKSCHCVWNPKEHGSGYDGWTMNATTQGQGMLRFADRLTEVSIHVFSVDLPDIRLVVMLRGFIQGPGYVVLVSFVGDVSVGVSHSNEKVQSGLLIGQLVTHANEVLVSERSWAVVGHQGWGL